MAGTPARPLLVRALELFDAEPAPADALAIDLGCGEGRDTAELLERGWRVLAIDAEPEAFDRLLARENLTHRDRLETRVARFEDADLPRCRLMNAAYALPFCPPEVFRALWPRVVSAIEPGGRFVGQIFGDRDDWAALPDRAHHRRGDLDALFSSFVIESFEEEERDGADALGFAKHWHIFHLIARRRS